jgi:periplasmic divalent cation tolerance protein
VETVIVLTNMPDRDSALALAEKLVEQKLAACVNVLAPCTSIYRWQGAIETAQEVPVMIKTTAGRYAELEQAIQSAHSYELPEIVALPLSGGLSRYLSWVESETCA